MKGIYINKDKQVELRCPEHRQLLYCEQEGGDCSGRCCFVFWCPVVSCDFVLDFWSLDPESEVV